MRKCHTHHPTVAMLLHRVVIGHIIELSLRTWPGIMLLLSCLLNHHCHQRYCLTNISFVVFNIILSPFIIIAILIVICHHSDAKLYALFLIRDEHPSLTKHILCNSPFITNIAVDLCTAFIRHTAILVYFMEICAYIICGMSMAHRRHLSMINIRQCSST